jgi:hypothetical protein
VKASEYAKRAGVYAQRLVDNEYVQENLANAAESLRSAYRRLQASGGADPRREAPPPSARRSAVAQRGRERASHRQAEAEAEARPPVAGCPLVGAGAAAAVAVASNEELRRKLLGGEEASGSGGVATPAGDSRVPVSA